MNFSTDEIGVLLSEGEDASYLSNSFKVHFDSTFQIVVNGVQSTTPAATCKTADVTALALVEGGLLAINEISYKIVCIEPDGMGFSTIVLGKTA